MSDRLNYYYRQKVTEAELDLGFAKLEVAERALATDQAIWGVMSGLVVSQHSSPQNLTVDISAGNGYDKLGQRLNTGSPQTVNCAVDDGSVSTAVTTPGNSKIVSIFAKFTRALTDPRLDGNSMTVYFSEAESFQFVVRQGAEAVSPIAPALDSTYVLLSDITLTYGQTQIVNANISTTRREDFIVASGTPRSIRSGNVRAAFAAMLGFFNSHVTAAADRHAASAIDGAATGNWADATNVAAGTLQAMLNGIVSALAATAGAGRIGAVATGNWADATPVAAGTVRSQLNGIVSALAAATGDVKMGSPARAGTPVSLGAGSVGSQVAALLTGLNAAYQLFQTYAYFKIDNTATAPSTTYPITVVTENGGFTEGATDEIQVPAAGTYILNANGEFTSSIAGTSARLGFTVEVAGVEVGRANNTRASATTTDTVHSAVSVVIVITTPASQRIRLRNNNVAATQTPIVDCGNVVLHRIK